MTVNSDTVVENGCGSEQLGLTEEEKMVVERLADEVKDVDGEDTFEEAIEGGESRVSLEEEEKTVESGGGKVDEMKQESLVTDESESFEEAMELPSQEGNGDVVNSDCLGPSTASLVERAWELEIGGSRKHTSEAGEQQGTVGPLHCSNENGEVSNVLVGGDVEDVQCGKEESRKESAVAQEKVEGGVIQHMQVSSNELCDADSDIVDQKRETMNQFPEDVFARIEIPIKNADIDDKEGGENLLYKDVSTGAGKRNLPAPVESFVDDTATAEKEHTNGTFRKEEGETSGTSTGDIDNLFGSPDEVEELDAAEAEELIFSETEIFPRDHDEATSKISSEEESEPSIQLRSVEELLHKHVFQSTITSENLSVKMSTNSSAESSMDVPVPPSHPVGLGSSVPLLEPISRAKLQSRSNEIVSPSSSQTSKFGTEENDKVQGSLLHKDTQSENSASAISGKQLEKQKSQTMKLDKPSEAKTREKLTVTTDESGTKPIGNSSTGGSSDSFRPPHPAGLGSGASLLQPASRTQQQAQANGTRLPVTEETVNGETDEDSETREKLQMIRVKFLRLAHRLGQTPHNPVVAQVLYRLGLAEQLRGSRAGAFSFDRASALAEQLEAAGQDALDFSCTIMVLGKTGVGKSATINSIFDEAKFTTDAFQIGTKKVQAVVGTVQGIQVRVIDTPGLLTSFLDQRHNEKILNSVKSFIKKTPPDIVLYLDRLDMQSRDYGDLPLLRTITDIFGPAIWFNAIVVLTHAASAPPEGPSGTLSYETFVAQRSHVVQQAIRQAAGDMRLMNPVSLVENHSACRTNRAGQRVLPNGQVWKPHLLLLSFASKILSEANALLKLQTNPPGKPFRVRSRVPPLPFLLSSLLQSRPQLRVPEEQFGNDDAMDDDLDESSDSDDECEYDELPPFKRLTKAQISKLSKEQRKAYFDELDYREKLFMKKQLKEERKQRKLLKKMAASGKQGSQMDNENMEEGGGSATVPVPMPDMALPASFDSDNPTHRYRYLDSSNPWLVRPVFEAHGWDHDVGYEGLNVERLFVVKDKIPLSISGQFSKDKKESNLQLECASSIKHGEEKATSLGFDMQTVGKEIAYTLRGETRFSNYRCNKAAAGLSVTLLGDALSAGLKFEDKLMLHKRFKVVMSGGAMAGRSDVAYGGSLEATLRDKDYPIGRSLSTFGLSIMDWHGDLAIGCNLQSQFPVGRSTNMTARANLNNRGSGQVSVRLNSSDQLQIALVGLLPLLRNIINNRLNSQSMS
ncbi:translocase of chloroplast 101, chloroplastic-like isoform X1 [Nymphaea colorata]|uniref:translocase of chloroplast 101, chloroplastic-like isoform X1 n=1 Tax=Nymphaea colorata TaxID=210225 RepID=UPI00214ED309|nr:translocase of chloroplast 101, chloroplastic-like isoform X1 [Nymphaea colorata]